MRQKKKMIADFVYSLVGIIVMNGVLQIVIYPGLEHRMGSTAFGEALTMISMIAVIAITFGSAANFSHMAMLGQKGRVSDGDYQLFLGISFLISLPVCILIMLYFGAASAFSSVLFYLLTIATILRYYAEVAFRRSLDYKRFCIFYILLAAGYLAGLLLYQVTHSWMACLLSGEILCVMYVLWKGKLFVKPVFRLSEQGKEILSACFVLAGTYLINALILHGDRVILQHMKGGDAVTVFYVASLGGKIIALAAVPLDGVIVGYLSKNGYQMKKKDFCGIWCLSVLGGVLISFGCHLFSLIFVHLFYPDVYLQAKPYFLLANAGQVFYFLATTLSIIILRYLHEKYQLYVNVVYLVLFCVLAFPLSAKYSVAGMAIALLAANVVKAVGLLVIGLLHLPEQG